MDNWTPVIVAALSSTALFGFIQFLIARHDKKKGTLAKLEAGMTEARKDSLRTQLLLLIADYPEDKSEIMRLAEHYFKDLKGNFYLSSIFTEWLKKYNITVPGWFQDLK